MILSELISVRVDGTKKVVSFSHHHINDLTAAQQIAGHVGELMDQSEQSDEEACETLSLDLTCVDRLTSVALNHLIGIQCQARSRGIRLVLTNVQQSVRDVFALTRLERMFELAGTSPRVSASAE